MPRREQDNQTLEVRPCIGGIQTKYPAPIVIASQSPDLLNVSFERRSIRRRDGCVPVNRVVAPRNSLRNAGRSYVGRMTGMLTDNTYKVVPGYGFIGHRPHFNNYVSGGATALTVSFLYTPEPDGDNPDEAANWFVFNERAGPLANTYTYRPLCSKGPLRGTRWNSGEGLGWAIFVYRAGANDYRWGCYIATNAAASPVLLTSNANDVNNPKPLHTYRVTFTATQTGGAGNAILSVAELQSDGTALLLQYTSALAANLLTNTCPIQVFDMPRPLIEAPVANGGLASATGYFRDVLRGEGRIQDLSVWSVDKTANGTDTSWVGSMAPVNTSVAQTGLLGHWAPETQSFYDRSRTWTEDKVLIPESRGLDAPLMLGPQVPMWQRSNGKPGLYFDGRTSYAFMPTALGSAFPGGAGGTNNESFTNGGSRNANTYEAIVGGANIGEPSNTIEVTFIPDSIEKVADAGGAEARAQALISWPGVCEFGISTIGRLYAMPQNAGAFDPATFFAFTFVPGNRYTVMYARDTIAGVTMYVNGASVGTIAGIANRPNVALSAMLIGVAEDAVLGGATREYVGATDPTTHFVGRIEDIRLGNVRVLGGGGVANPSNALNRDLTAAELYLNSQQLAGLDDSTTAVTVRRSINVPSAPFFLHTQALQQTMTKTPFFSTALGRLLVPVSVTDTTYVLAAAPPGTASAGVDQVNNAQTKASMYAAWWNFDASSLSTKLESRYRKSIEASSLGGAPTPVDRYFYSQDLAIPDKLGFALPLTLRSREMDIEALTGGVLTTQFNWGEVAPQELVPRIAMGLVPDLPGKTPITGLAQLKHSSGQRLTVAAAASSLYWLRPPWATNVSPYPKANDSGQTSFFGSGHIRNHIQIAANSTWDLSNADLTIEFWVMVPELGTKREVAINWAGTVGQYNWRVVIDEAGGIYVAGIAGGAPWRAGTATATTGGNRPLVPGVWHHVAITIDVSAIANDVVWIDGVAQTMAAPVGGHAAAWNGGGGKKFIAGHPLEFGSPDQTNDTFVAPFLGWLRDFRVSTGLRYTATFQKPRTPLTSDGTTITLLPLNDGSDAVATASGSTIARGEVRCRELLPILDGSLLCNNSSQVYPYSARVYLDTLFLTNGLGPPLAVRWRGVHGPRYADPRGRGTPRPFGFSVGRMGVTTPGYDPPSLTGEVSVVSPATGFAENVQYAFAVTFVTEDGIESDPVSWVLTIPNNAGGDGWQTIRLNALPRSLEPHVVARRIYYGITTPTRLSRTSATDDNLTDDVELTATTDGTIGGGPAISTVNGAPPPARFIEIHKGRAWLFNQPAVAPTELYVSSPAVSPLSLENFPVLNIIRVNETTGVPGAFLQEHLGSLYVGDRDGVYAMSLGQTFETSRKDRLLAGKGFCAGHSLAAFDNHVFGAMEKGVHIFDGSGIDYIAEDLEGLWANLDRSEDAALLQHGIYHEPTNQYWLSVKRSGEEYGREIVVFDKVVSDPQTGRNPWTLHSTLRHSFLARIEDEVTDLPYIYLGTPDGRIFQMQTGGVDGSRALVNPSSGASFTLSGTATGGSLTTLTMVSANFDTLGSGAGLRGLWVTITHANGSVDEVRIASNTATSLTFESGTPSGTAVAAGATFIIGGYWAYYTTPWLALTSITNTKVVRWLDLDFLPQSGSLEVRALAAVIGVQGAGVSLTDAFNYSAVLTQNRKTIPAMTYGYHPETVRFEVSRALYWRAFFGTRGINVPFEVFGWSTGFEDDGNRKGLIA